MSLETRIVAGVLLGIAGIAVFILWLQSAELFEEAVVEGLAGPQPVHAPAAMPAVALPVPLRPVSLLFEFDRAELRAVEAEKLDALLRAARESGFKRFDAVGHADRLGPAAYNMALSARRAASVRDYLVEKDVDASLVRAEAKGELQPVSGDACVDMGPERRGTAGLVECLQADRRVEVKVITP